MDINELKAKYDECMSRTTCDEPCIECDINMPQYVWEAMGTITEYLEEINQEGQKQMNITNQYRHNRCIAIAAQLDQIAHMIDYMEEIEEELLDKDEYNKYIVGASKTICELSDRMRSKSKWYLDDRTFDPTSWKTSIPCKRDDKLYIRVGITQG